MTPERLEEIKKKLGGLVKETVVKSPRRAYLYVEPKDSYKANRIMFEDLKARLCTASGIDTRSGIEILYHWGFDEDGCVLTVKTKVPKPFPEIESIAPFLKAAEWIEREINELLGVTFRNHPSPGHLVLDDNWPEGVYPLRKDFDQIKRGFHE
jgi:Ni,Fe-hydrogenase III component G